MLINRSLNKLINLKPTLNNGSNETKVAKALKYPIEKLCSMKLKKIGTIFMGKCPFHQEKTPSFAIYPITNSFYCFACEEGGDVINFYMKINKCNFQTAREALAI